MKHWVCTTALALTVAIAGCGGSDDVEPQKEAFTHISADWGLTDLRETYVVRDEAQWAKVWSAHEPPMIPPTTRPVVDFVNYQILGLTQGTGPSGCWGLRIDNVLRQGDRMRVEYVLRTGPVEPSFACTAMAVPLTDFVQVPRTEGEVEFVKVLSIP